MSSAGPITSQHLRPLIFEHSRPIDSSGSGHGDFEAVNIEGNDCLKVCDMSKAMGDVGQQVDLRPET